MAVRSANDLEAWSAAFICSVYDASNIAATDGFIFARRHIIYIVGALRNRENADETKPFWLYDSIEMINEATPAPGDLICYNRFDKNGVYSNHSYSSLRNSYWDNTTVPTGVGHCNIVVALSVHNGRQVIETIGGNVNGSVRYTYLIIDNEVFWKVDEDGSNPKAENDIFAIVKILECPEFPIN